MKTLLLTCGLAIALASPAAAQGALNEGQGHPLKGTWIGDWGTNKQKRTPVLIVMDWDGKVIAASLNPGPEAIQFTKAELNPANWTVHLEATAGGTLLLWWTARSRTSGQRADRSRVPWMQGNQKGDFKITRQ
jgi:hypothetical protein